MIAARRRRELGILRLAGATARQVRSMARWGAALIGVIGVGVGLLITAAALLPLSHALTGHLHPYIPARQLAAIVGLSTILAFTALALPTSPALGEPAVETLGLADCPCGPSGRAAGSITGLTVVNIARPRRPERRR